MLEECGKLAVEPADGEQAQKGHEEGEERQYAVLVVVDRDVAARVGSEQGLKPALPAAIRTDAVNSNDGARHERHGRA